jgi:AcrR family transcriptional regulator
MGRNRRNEVDLEMNAFRASRIKREPSSDLGRRLISASVGAFAEKGILGARVAEITRVAGTTDPAFYRYFPSLRDAALFIISEHYWRPLNQRVAHFRQATRDAGPLFEAVVTALLRSVEDDPATPWLDESKVFPIVVSQMRNPFLLPDSLLDPEYAAFLAMLERLFRDGRKQGCFASGPRPMVMAHSLVTTIHGLLGTNAVSLQGVTFREDEIRRMAYRLAGFEPGGRP